MRRLALFMWLAAVSFGANASMQQLQRSADEWRLADRREEVVAAIEKSQVVFVGEIESVGPPPRVRTSKAPATQSVRYRVVEILKGDLTAEQRQGLSVGHVLMSSARYATPSTAAPAGLALSSNVFSAGKRLIVMANEVEPTYHIWMETDYDVGTWPATSENLAGMKQLLNAR